MARELKIKKYTYEKVWSAKKNKDYPVIKFYIEDLFGELREYSIFINRTDMQFLGLKPADFGLDQK